MGRIRTHHLSTEEKEKVLQGAAASLGRHEEILFAYALGSFLEEGPFRDLDLVVYVQPGESQYLGFRYEDGLAQEVTHDLNLPFPVDLRLLNGAPLAFQYHAFHGRLLLDRDPDRRVDLLACVLSRYFDIKPIIAHHMKEAFTVDAEPRSDSIQA